LGARTVQRADQWQGENALQQTHGRGGQLEQLSLLARDDVFSVLLKDFGSESPQLV
jgi:hypothetical protein